MYVCKKLINSDLLQLAILVSLLRLDLNSYLDGLWNNRLEASDIFLGTNIAYSHTRFNYLHNTINGYIHPKSIDAMLYERSSIFAELNSLGRYSRFQPLQSNVFAYLVDQEDHEVQEPPQHSLPGSSGNPSESANVRQDVDSRNDGNTEMRNETDHESHETSNVLASPGSELSHEDMNLIEILWKQDIDLGLTKDAFDFSRNSKEVAKPKHTEVLKQEKESPKEVQPQSSTFDPWEGVSYTIDGETGEHIVQQHTINSCLPDVENCTLNEFDLEKLAEELQNVPLDETLRLLSDECADNQTNDLKKDRDYSSTFDGLDYENLTNNVALGDVDCDDSLIEQLKDLDSLLGKDIEDAESQVNGIFSNAEDCWQNITTVLSLPSDVPNDLQPGTSQTQTAMSTVASSNNEISSNITSVNANFSAIFNNSLLQDSSLASPLLSFNSVTGLSCVSSSQPSSFSAFSNHTDPVSESMMNVTYDHNFTNFFGPENTTTPDFLSNILFDEDLELMDMSHVADGGAGISTNKSVQDYKDTSRDSALSSMDSDRSSSDDEECMDYTSQGASFYGRDFGVCSSASTSSPSPSLSYCSTGSSSCSDRSTAPKKYKLFGKKAFHFHDRKDNDSDDNKQENHKKQPQKPSHLKFEENCMEENFGDHFNSPACDKAIDLSEKYRFSKQKDVTVGNTVHENFHHNHTYSMPFESESDSHKPVTRDKNEELDESGRDEKRAEALKIPISTYDIINLPIDEFNERVSKYDLNEAQLVLIRDIRRRGKNKVAAQNCRKRKIGQIVNLQEDLKALLDEKKTLKAEQEEILSYRHIVADKYNQLYKLIKQSTLSDPPPPRPPDFLHHLTLNERERDSSIPPNSTSLNGSDRNSCSKGARSKRKTDQK